MGQDLSTQGKRKRFEESQELSNAIQKTFLERYNIDSSDISNIGFEVAAAGSSVLQIALRENWEDSDLDLYVKFNNENITNLENYLRIRGYVKIQEYPSVLPFKHTKYMPTNLLRDTPIPIFPIVKIFTEEHQNVPHYASGGFMSRNRLRRILTFKNTTSNLNIQIIACGKDLRETIDSFDLDVCSIAFMFFNKYIYLSKDLDPDRIMKKQIMMRNEYKALFANGNYVLHRRVQKYESRGFVILNKPKLIGFIRSVNKAINRLNERMQDIEFILENISLTDYNSGSTFSQFGYNTYINERRNLEGVNTNNYYWIDVNKLIDEKGGNILLSLFDKLEKAQNENEKQKIRLEIGKVVTKLKYKLTDYQIKINNLLNKRESLLKGQIDIFKNKTEKVVERALYMQRAIDLFKQKIITANINYKSELRKIINDALQPEILKNQARYLLDFDQGFNCTNSDDVDPFTREPISELEPTNTFQNVVFNEQGQEQRVQCYDLDSLIIWIESKEKPKKNQWGRRPDPEPGTFPDTARTLTILERIRYTTACEIRNCTIIVRLYTEKFNKYKTVLDGEKPEFPYEKALIGGKKKAKTKRRKTQR